jgi:hypothetical protein
MSSNRYNHLYFGLEVKAQMDHHHLNPRLAHHCDCPVYYLVHLDCFHLSLDQACNFPEDAYLGIPG